MADPIHVHSQFDPQQRAIAIVEEVEREALDEEMVLETLQKFIRVLASRCERSSQLIAEEHERDIEKRRSERLRAKEKGVAPQSGRHIPGLIRPGQYRPSSH